MRVLLSSTPLAGHLIPLLPLARAFRERGDNVALVTGSSAVPFVADEEIEFLPAGPELEAMFKEVLRTTGHDLMEQGPTVETEAELFASARVDLTIDDALAQARAWEPDLILSEHFDFIGPLVGAVLGVPAASLAFGVAMLPETVEATTARVRSRYKARGLAYAPARWYLDTCPPALQRPGWEAPEGRIALRPEPHRKPGQEVPARTQRGDRRPRVLVSFGTVFSSSQAVGPLLRALLEQDVDVRVTLLSSVPEEFAVDAEDRLEFAAYKPFVELLQDVDVVLTHGGAGTVLGALCLGIPMVVVPQGADQPIQAERVAAAGAGISFPLGGVAPERVAEAVREVLAERDYRDAAEKIAAQIAEYDSSPDVAEQLAAALAR
ncbi:glycosyltransferase [Streptomyces sp. NL15-2K]|uniref:glycosyltransferase n=1 Tax=Streptomyces sp. NL15-2K TaxID=376149 RepID=UPI000F563B6F|nr:MULTISPECIES: glycosyltransferase [Actinomycetes]WKX11250.1 glycosyltransferase [Kutzneria buriramensis]